MGKGGRKMEEFWEGNGIENFQILGFWKKGGKGKFGRT